MDVIPWLTDWYALPTFELWLLVIIVAVCGWGAGFLIDGVMQEAGLGPTVDGLIALCGAWLGLYLRYRWVAPGGNGYLLDGVFAVVTPLAFLLAIGAARRRSA